MLFNQENVQYLLAWLEQNKENIPLYTQDLMGDSWEGLIFLHDVYAKIMAELSPQVYALMKDQYPVITTETRTELLDEINEIATSAGDYFLCQLFKLVEGQKQGVNLREKYPKFDQWLDFYARPHKPKVIKESRRRFVPYLNDEEWAAYREKENKEMLKFFNWQTSRQEAYVDLIQTLLLKYYKDGLDKFDYDEWIIYSVYIIDEYEIFKCSCEQLEMFIDCRFPVEYLKLTSKELCDKHYEIYDDNKERFTDLRRRRISGEKI